MSAHRFEAVKDEVEQLRTRVNSARRALASFYVEKAEIIELMCVCTLAQEPLLLIGRPGTAKSDLVVKFCQALGLAGDEYFEYMLTKFTEPSELIGPIDIQRMKDHGEYYRRTAGKLPTAKVVFLDEIFKSNSAILNTLLSVINERKFYQDGKPEPVALQMLFAATNTIPEFDELAALKDRFTLKIESESVKDRHFDALIDKGVANELYRAFNRRPWADLCSLEDFQKLKVYLDQTMAAGAAGDQDGASTIEHDRAHYFPDEVFTLFKRILRTLEKEDKVAVSDRKVIKLYKLLRARALLIHGGTVRREDLTLLRYCADRSQDFGQVKAKVDALLDLES